MTPPFAEYTSGHSAFSGAASQVFNDFAGTTPFKATLTVTIAKGSSKIESGVPARRHHLSFKSFNEAADQAGLSRRYGGIHFEQADLNGRTLGRQIGDAAWNKAQTYINGTAPTPPTTTASTTTTQATTATETLTTTTDLLTSTTEDSAPRPAELGRSAGKAARPVLPHADPSWPARTDIHHAWAVQAGTLVAWGAAVATASPPSAAWWPPTYPTTRSTGWCRWARASTTSPMRSTAS